MNYESQKSNYENYWDQEFATLPDALRKIESDFDDKNQDPKESVALQIKIFMKHQNREIQKKANVEDFIVKMIKRNFLTK